MASHATGLGAAALGRARVRVGPAGRGRATRNASAVGTQFRWRRTISVAVGSALGSGAQMQPRWTANLVPPSDHGARLEEARNSQPSGPKRGMGIHISREAEMAEIPIERKKGTNWLPLIIGALVVLALLAWWASRNRDDSSTTSGVTTSDTTATAARDTSGARR